MKQIVNSENLKTIARETISELAGIVKKTLGPGGNPIILKRDGQDPDGTPKKPLVTKDGVTVAEAVIFSDPVKNTVSQAVIQVSKDTVNEAGDGTTTALVLAEAIYKAGFKYIDQGQNSILLYEGLKDIKDEVLESINKVKKKVTVDSVRMVAEISSNGDKEIANIVADAIEAVGEDGHVTIEEGNTRDTVLDIVEGAMYKQGYRNFGALGQHLVTDKARDVCEMREPAILLYGGRLDSIQDLSKVMAQVYKPNEQNQVTDPVPMLIIANDFSEEVKNMIVANRVQAGLPIAGIKTPFDGSPNARTGILEDLATLTGATISAKGLLELKDVNLDHIGSAERIEIGPQETVIFGGQGDEEEVINRVDELKRLLDNTPHEFDKGNIRIRIGKLTGGIAVIRVGGDSELEILEKKDRIEDALCAAKVALQDGIVEGGGMTLLRISEALEGTSDAHNIMREALRAPFNQIVSNVGEVPQVVYSEIKIGTKGKGGYNARTKEVVKNMIKEGIIDPAKVTKSALENAVSIAGLLLTTGGCITDEPPKASGGSMQGMPNPLAMMGA